jgi:hypothetical protein
MNKVFILFSLLLASCSSVPYRKLDVSSRDEALTVINNQANFLKETFTQSQESYYGGLRWSEECLKENKIGELKEKGMNLSLENELFFSASGDSGQCDGVKKRQIFLFCDGENYIREYRFDLVENKEAFSLCN